MIIRQRRNEGKNPRLGRGFFQNYDKYSRKEIDRLTEYAKKYHAHGLAWLKYENNAFAGSIAKFVDEENQKALLEQLNII